MTESLGFKALSGRQPWWWAILHAGKRIENRVWNTSYRGPLWLHAARGCTKAEHQEAMAWMVNQGLVQMSQLPEFGNAEKLRRGGIVGRARIIDVIPPWTRAETIKLMHPGLDPRWHMPEQHGFVLTDVQPVPFVECNGALGLFRLDQAVLDRLPKEAA